MIETERALSTNRAGWDRVASQFHGVTALPEYGPLAPTEESLRLLDLQSGLQLEALLETPLDPARATEAHADPARWYSVGRADVMPTTFILNARKPTS